MKIPANKKFSANWYHLGLCLVVLVVGLVRTRLLALPFERDEGEYAYMGKLILQGGIPYRDACNMKLPGTYCMYSFIISIFGSTPTGVHLGLMLVSLATIIILFFALKKLFGPYIALTTATIYGLLSISPPFYGFAAHATHFINFFVALGLFFYARFNEKNGLLSAFLTGLMFGLAFLMKQQAVFFLLFAIIIIATSTARNKPAHFKHIAANVLSCGMGTLLPYLALVAIMLSTGAFGNFWFWTVQYAHEYTARNLGLPEIFFNFNFTFRGMQDEFMAIWLLVVIGLVFTWLGKYTLKQKIFITLLFPFSFATICPGYYFRTHYFITLFPAIGLLVAIALDFLVGLISRIRGLPYLKALPFVVASLLWANELYSHKDFYTHQKLSSISKQFYHGCPFVEAPEIAKFIEANTSEKDLVAILGNEPEILVYANRRAATRFLYMYPLMEEHKLNGQMQKYLREDIEASKPRIILYTVDVWTEPPVVPDGEWVQQYIKANYEKVGAVEILANEEPSKFHWGEGAKGVPGNDNCIEIYKKKGS